MLTPGTTFDCRFPVASSPGRVPVVPLGVIFAGGSAVLPSEFDSIFRMSFGLFNPAVTAYGFSDDL